MSKWRRIDEDIKLWEMQNALEEGAGRNHPVELHELHFETGAAADISIMTAPVNAYQMQEAWQEMERRPDGGFMYDRAVPRHRDLTGGQPTRLLRREIEKMNWSHRQSHLSSPSRMV